MERGIGLTDFYNLMDEGGFRDVESMHRDLDRTVLDAYGWKHGLADDPLEIRARLASLHAEIAGGNRSYEPFPETRRLTNPSRRVSPGVPTWHFKRHSAHGAAGRRLCGGLLCNKLLQGVAY